MKQFPIVLRHFLKRSFLDPMSVIFLILLPLGIVILNSVININIMETAGNAQNTAAEVTAIAALFAISFQLFSGDVLIYSVYDDLRGPVGQRLRATPVPPNTFFVGALLASWIFNIVQATFILGVTTLVFDTSWGSPFVLIAAILLVSVISQLMSLIISQFAPTRKAASGILTAIGLFMMFLSGALFVPLGNSAIAEFIRSYGGPLALAWRSILFSGVVEDNVDMNQAMFNIGILAIIAVVLAGFAIITGRRRRVL